MSLKRKFNEYLCIYSIGSVLYASIELLFRGYTHFTMVITGGICAMLIHLINQHFKRESIILRAFLSCLIITLTEFSVGCIVNLYFGLRVWDYSNRAFNLLGQICPLFSLYWFFLSFVAIGISQIVAYEFNLYYGEINVKK